MAQHHKRKTHRETLTKAEDFFKKYSVDQIKDWKSLDLYFLMGLDSEKEDHTENELKDAFRKQAKLFHPDKLVSKNIDDNGATFIALSRAYQTFTNPQKKRQYDCIAFDESIPEDRAYSAEEFFLEFGPAFQRNAKYSRKPYTVCLGHADSPDEHVVSFYKFWQSFESTRSFEFLCEDEDCQSREMRRQVQKKNKEVLDEKKQQDNVRIRKLINLSIKHDPRVNKNAKKQAPAEPETIDADGWKSSEVAALAKLAKQYPRGMKNRLDIIFSGFARHSRRTKREMQGKLLKIDNSTTGPK